jgi:pimeloyl-ACP methyl ester carboxylesterase
MATFVLVHGGYHGGWCWKWVARELRSHDHEVYAPTLTGLGERSHLLTADVDAVLHARDVSSVLWFEDLTDVILVGHSYGGLVITLAAEESEGRLRELVYVDAVVPEDKQRPLELWSEAGREWVLAHRDPRLWVHPPMPDMAARFGVPEDKRAWTDARLTPQPANDSERPIRLAPGVLDRLQRTYIRCRQSVLYGGGVPLALRTPPWRYHEIDTGHDAMLSAPSALGDLLHRIAST